ncbi:unnamed protein product [Linum tenue]|uniref:Uncharacterized protein n=1 Tax=Linum tenue TaxID=586396 RepID=A0AAV0QC95_9ROSI|nr:unnamed protein product [Linum tenue]
MHVIRVQALTKLNTHGPTSSKNRWLFLSNACFFSSPNRTEISARIILSLGLPSPELGTAGAYSQLRRQSCALSCCVSFGVYISLGEASHASSLCASR